MVPIQMKWLGWTDANRMSISGERGAIRHEEATMTDMLDPDAVPVRKIRGICFVALDDIPEPYRQQFEAALRGSGCPVVEGYGECAYAQDWLDWSSGNWPWGGGPKES
jgi:hypothetical protein